MQRRARCKRGKALFCRAILQCALPILKIAYDLAQSAEVFGMLSE